MLALAQQPAGGWIERQDPRYRVLIRAKMRAGGFPVDVCIRDVSARGVCVVSASPPPRGTIVELTGPVVPIVGKVVWANELRFGVQVGGRINVAMLLSKQPKAPGLEELVAHPAYEKPVRTPAQVAEANRQLGSTMQYLFFCLLAGSAAMALAHTAFQSLSETSGRVIAGLETAR